MVERLVLTVCGELTTAASVPLAFEDQGRDGRSQGAADGRHNRCQKARSAPVPSEYE